jgi:hypothetical protein
MEQDSPLAAASLTITKTRILERSNGRMKITFNLSKPEAEAFKNFYTIINQPNVDETEFAKTAFLMGLQTMERAIIARMTEEAENEAAKAKEEGSEPEIVEVVETPEAEEVSDEPVESKD